MNLFDCITCNQYYELVKTGRDGKKALFNGNLLNTACIFLLLLTFVNIVFLNSAVEQTYSESLASIFGERSGKRLGELMAIPLLAIIYFAVKKTIGTEPHFERITSAFDALSEPDKKAIFKRGSVFLFTCFGLFLITFFVQL